MNTFTALPVVLLLVEPSVPCLALSSANMYTGSSLRS
jgi:hypothetical protein